MRVMVFVKSDADSEAGAMPSEKLLTDMGKFNEELVNAGIMLEGEGLHPSSKGKRVTFSGGNRIVTDGPFAETNELVGGFWMWKVKSMDEAVEWAKRIPFGAENSPKGAVVEIRPIFEMEEFGAEFTPELRAQEDRIREQAAKLKNKD